MHGGVPDEAAASLSLALNLSLSLCMVDNSGVFTPPFFLHPFAQQEFIYVLKKHTKRALFNTRQEGHGAQAPLGPYVRMCLAETVN